MSDKQVSNLQKILQSLATRVPKIILQRVEEIFPSLNFVNTLNILPDSYRETCHDENQVVDIKLENVSDIKLEDVTDIQEEEDPVIKAEHERPEGINYTLDKLDDSYSSDDIPMNTLNEHQLIHDKVSPYSSDVHHESFGQSHLEIHQHTNRWKCLYSCDMCNKSLSNQRTPETHQQLHTREQPYLCGVCNKSFSQKPALKVHLCIHSGEWSFFCDVYNKSFSSKGSLQVHQRMHSGERPYS